MSHHPLQTRMSDTHSIILIYCRPITTFAFAFAGFQCFLMFMGCMLICYAERESLERMMMRSNIISKRNPTVSSEHGNDNMHDPRNSLLQNNNKNNSSSGTSNANNDKNVKRNDIESI